MSRGDERRPARRAPTTGPKQRVQKVLARAGLGSRRQAEALIAAGRVRVGGKRVDRQGVSVDPRREDVSVDGKRISAEPLTYLLFHKPREVMCTMQDPLGRRSVVDFLRGAGARVVPVGRLDYQTGGVLLLTNDGEFAREMLHPSSGVTKEYLLKVKGPVDAPGLQRLRERIDIGGKWTKPARVERMRADDANSWLLVSLQEGKNRQVRRLAENAGYRVMRLTRTRFAGLTTEGLRPGQWRELTASELRTLRAHNASQEEAAASAPVTLPTRGRRRPGTPSSPSAKPQRSGGRAPRKSSERANATRVASGARGISGERSEPGNLTSWDVTDTNIADGVAFGADPEPRGKGAELDPRRGKRVPRKNIARAGFGAGPEPRGKVAELDPRRGKRVPRKNIADGAGFGADPQPRGKGAEVDPRRGKKVARKNISGGDAFGADPQPRGKGAGSDPRRGKRVPGKNIAGGAARGAGPKPRGKGADSDPRGGKSVPGRNVAGGVTRGAGPKARGKGADSDPRKGRPTPPRHQRRKPRR
ncbi:MAG: hypothetical protein RL033_3666 [Pseudomonadota bacterium]